MAGSPKFPEPTVVQNLLCEPLNQTHKWLTQMCFLQFLEKVNHPWGPGIHMKIGNLLVPLSLYLDLVYKAKMIAQKMKPRVSVFIFQMSWVIWTLSSSYTYLIPRRVVPEWISGCEMESVRAPPLDAWGRALGESSRSLFSQLPETVGK